MLVNCARSVPIKRFVRNATAIFLISVVLTGCVVRPQNVPPIPTNKDFSQHSCEKLDGEARRLESEYWKIRNSNHKDVRQWMGRINGEAEAVTQAIRLRQCKVCAPAIIYRPQGQKNRGTEMPKIIHWPVETGCPSAR